MFKSGRLIENLKNKITTKNSESLEYGDVNDITDVSEKLIAMMKKAIPNMKSTSKAQAAMKACEKAADEFISLASDEVEEAAIVELVTGDALLKEIDAIVADKTAKEIDGVLVDLQTANLISQVAKALSPENKAKFLAKGATSAAQVAWKLVK